MELEIEKFLFENNMLFYLQVRPSFFLNQQMDLILKLELNWSQIFNKTNKNIVLIALLCFEI